MLRKAGYYTAYKGKWHLSREFDTRSVEQFMTPHMEKYGFADNFSPGDLIGQRWAATATTTSRPAARSTGCAPRGGR